MSIVSRNVKTPSARTSIAVTRILVGVVFIVAAGFALSRYSHHNAVRHAAYVKQVADSFHYEVGKSYYCWDSSVDAWKPCTVLGVEDNYQEYFVEDVEGTDNTKSQFHVRPTDMQHKGIYTGHTL